MSLVSERRMAAFIRVVLAAGLAIFSTIGPARAEEPSADQIIKGAKSVLSAGAHGPAPRSAGTGRRESGHHRACTPGCACGETAPMHCTSTMTTSRSALVGVEGSTSGHARDWCQRQLAGLVREREGPSGQGVGPVYVGSRRADPDLPTLNLTVSERYWALDPCLPARG